MHAQSEHARCQVLDELHNGEDDEARHEEAHKVEHADHAALVVSLVCDKIPQHSAQRQRCDKHPANSGKPSRTECEIQADTWHKHQRSGGEIRALTSTGRSQHRTEGKRCARHTHATCSLTVYELRCCERWYVLHRHFNVFVSMQRSESITMLIDAHAEGETQGPVRSQVTT